MHLLSLRLIPRNSGSLFFNSSPSTYFLFFEDSYLIMLILPLFYHVICICVYIHIYDINTHIFVFYISLILSIILSLVDAFWKSSFQLTTHFSVLYNLLNPSTEFSISLTICFIPISQTEPSSKQLVATSRFQYPLITLRIICYFEYLNYVWLWFPKCVGW